LNRVLSYWFSQTYPALVGFEIQKHLVYAKTDRISLCYYLADYYSFLGSYIWLVLDNLF
jgi:hypothetical protein